MFKHHGHHLGEKTRHEFENEGSARTVQLKRSMVHLPVQEQALALKPSPPMVWGEVIQAKSGSMAAGAEGADGPGRAMPDDIRAKMEGAFGQDFSSVRIHEGPQASQVGALAYTQGEHIHFAQGQYNPETEAGQELLGHELTHVVQQRAGRVATPQAKGALGVSINDDSGLEAEADRMGAQSARGQRVSGGPVQMRADTREVIQLWGGKGKTGGEEEEEEDPEEQKIRTDYTHVDVYSYGAMIDKQGNFQGDTAKEAERVRNANRLKFMKPGVLATRLLMLSEKVKQAHKAMAGESEEASKSEEASESEGGDDHILGIFTAPEWFFKNPGKPFSSSDKSKLIAHFTALSKLCPDMLIIPGSMLWSEGRGKNARARNTTFAFLNGQMLKEHNKKNDLGDTSGYKPSVKAAYQNASKEDESDTRFEVGNLAMSIEICGDHGDRRALQEQKAGKTSPDGVDVQIIVSHGASFLPSGNASRDGGLVVTNDSSFQSNDKSLGNRSVHVGGQFTPDARLQGREQLSEMHVGNGPYALPVPRTVKSLNQQKLQLLNKSAQLIAKEVGSWMGEFHSDSIAPHLKPLVKDFNENYRDALAGCDKEVFLMLVNQFYNKVELHLKQLTGDLEASASAFLAYKRPQVLFIPRRLEAMIARLDAQFDMQRK